DPCLDHAAQPVDLAVDQDREDEQRDERGEDERDRQVELPPGERRGCRPHAVVVERSGVSRDVWSLAHGPGIPSWRIPDALAPIDRPASREGCTSYARRGRGSRAPASSGQRTAFWSADRAAGARSPGVAAGADPAAVDDNGGAVAHAQLAAER